MSFRCTYDYIEQNKSTIRCGEIIKDITDLECFNNLDMFKYIKRRLYCADMIRHESKINKLEIFVHGSGEYDYDKSSLQRFGVIITSAEYHVEVILYEDDNNRKHVLSIYGETETIDGEYVPLFYCMRFLLAVDKYCDLLKDCSAVVFDPSHDGYKEIQADKVHVNFKFKPTHVCSLEPTHVCSLEPTHVCSLESTDSRRVNNMFERSKIYEKLRIRLYECGFIYPNLDIYEMLKWDNN